MYKLEYLPNAHQDLINLVNYITYQLKNPIAADKLAEELIESAEKLTKMPYIHPLYFPIRPLKYEYRKLFVKNYIMFYRVEEQPIQRVIIARIIYAKSNYENRL